MRAQTVLAWDDGCGAVGIADRRRTTKPTVYKWVDRFDKGGVAALETVFRPAGRVLLP